MPISNIPGNSSTKSIGRTLIASKVFSNDTAPFIISGIPQDYSSLLLIIKNIYITGTVFQIRPNDEDVRVTSSYGTNITVSSQNNGSVIGNVGVTNHSVAYEIFDYANTIGYHPIKFSGAYGPLTGSYNGGGVSYSTLPVTSIVITATGTSNKIIVSGEFKLYGVN